VVQNAGCLSCFAVVPASVRLASSGLTMVRAHEQGLMGVPLMGANSRVVQSPEHGWRLETWQRLMFLSAQSRLVLWSGSYK
jgi:hypothetical protein